MNTNNIYSEAKRRIAEEEPRMPIREEKKRKARERAREYSKTEKGKIANRKKCWNWQRRNPEKVRGYVVRWQARFFEKYGVKYTTYLYRRSHGLPVPKMEEEADG